MEMKEDANSWIRRAKFSHTVCHRLDSSRLGAVSLNPQSSGLKARSAASSSKPKAVHDDSLIRTAATSSSQEHTRGNLQIEPAVTCSKQKSVSIGSQVQRNPLTSKQRSVSPLPHMTVSESFKEARSEKKRFSTPLPRRIQSDKGIKANSFLKDSCNRKASKSDASNASPLSHSGTLKIGDKSRIRKDSAWYKIFDHAGGKVSNVEAADEHTIDMSQLFLGAKFAHGAHSRLYHGMYKDEPVAVKIINIPDDDENRNLAAKLEQQSNREITLLSRFHHRNVIKFVAACKKAPVYCVITEYLSEGSLRAYLHKLDQKSLPLEKLVEIALDIARGMEYIHSQGVIHRDMKPENVLIDQDFHMKIADFGIACEEAYCDLLADDQGTYRWMAPEMIKRRSYGRKVDVYSYGLILWELIAGTIPYEDMSPIQAAFAVVNKNLRPVIPSFCPPALQALIEQCWSSQPDKRPEFSQIVKVLEQFQSSLRRDGTLSLSQNPCCQDPKKKVLQWIQKIAAHPNPNTGAVPKPKFM